MVHRAFELSHTLHLPRAQRYEGDRLMGRMRAGKEEGRGLIKCARDAAWLRHATAEEPGLSSLRLGSRVYRRDWTVTEYGIRARLRIGSSGAVSYPGPQSD